MVMPLSMFPPEKRAEIERLAALPDPPAKYLYIGDGDGRCIARINSRAYYEWWLRRGRNILEQPIRQNVHPALREAVITRDGLVCRLCDEAVAPGDVHIDHIIPVSKGGPTRLGNLQVAHSTCNIRKGNRA